MEQHVVKYLKCSIWTPFGCCWHVIPWNNSNMSFVLLGVRPFACPHCDKKFRTSGHRKTHIASHFKHTELRKMRHQRKPAKVRVGRSSVPVPDIPLQEPILITDLGKTGPRVLGLIRCSSFGTLGGVCIHYGICRKYLGLVLMTSSLEIALLG